MPQLIQTNKDARSVVKERGVEKLMIHVVYPSVSDSDVVNAQSGGEFIGNHAAEFDVFVKI